MAWYIRTAEGEAGPFSESEIEDGLRNGIYSAQTRVKADDGLMWQRLDESDLGATLGIKAATITTDEGEIRRIQPDAYRPVKVRGLLLQICLSLFAALCLISLVPLGFVSINSLIDPPFPDDLMNNPYLIGAIDLHYIAMLGRLIVFCPLALCFAFFFHQAYRNIRVLGAANATMPAHGTWMWFLVPFANMVQPIKAVSQLWEGAHALSGQQKPGTLPLFLWWTGWLVQAFLLRIGDISFNELFRRASISIRYYEPSEFQFVCLVLFIGMLGLFMSTVGLMMIVTRISKLNATLKQRFDLEAFT